MKKYKLHIFFPGAPTVFTFTFQSEEDPAGYDNIRDWVLSENVHAKPPTKKLELDFCAAQFLDLEEVIE